MEEEGEGQEEEEEEEEAAAACIRGVNVRDKTETKRVGRGPSRPDEVKETKQRRWGAGRRRRRGRWKKEGRDMVASTTKELGGPGL